jgi:hypothetical protein
MWEIPILQLPKELQDYARGVADLPKGTFKVLEVNSAKKHRREFFRKLQKYKGGLQYRWQDYMSLMHDEIQRHVKLKLEKQLLDDWESLVDSQGKLQSVCDILVLDRIRGPVSVGKRNRIITECRQYAIRLASQDPRLLGEMEERVLGKADYGIPTCKSRL